MSALGAQILPNLGAEEGGDWRAYPRQAHARVAARLFSHLFSGSSILRDPELAGAGPWRSVPCERLWPGSLGPPPEAPIFPWLESAGRVTAWLNTASLEASVREALGMPLSGPAPDRVALVHDKAFAVRAAQELGLVADSVAPWIEILDAEACADPERVLDRLSASLRRWPDWLEGRFTLKPRQGTSGRGRVGGRDRIDPIALRGALPRLAERGGAIFEPWLARRSDLSITLHVPAPDETGALPTLLGSLEMLTSASGVFRGHCGEVDSRGRIHSGLPADESLRADAVRVAERARAQGFFGPCGVDAFSHFEPTATPDRECWRHCVEFNARPTMGLVTIGLVRRALPSLRETLGLEPGMRRAFAMVLLGPDFGPHASAQDRALVEACGPEALVLDLAAPTTSELPAPFDVARPIGCAEPPAPNREPRPILLFAPDRERLRQALRRVLGC